MNTVAKPVAMNVRVATSARSESREETCDKGEPAGELVVLVRRKQPRGDAADAGDPAAHRHQHDGGQADQGASDRRGDRCEGCHCHSIELSLRYFDTVSAPQKNAYDQ